MLVHCDRPSPRARYVIRHVLHNILGVPVEFVEDAGTFSSAAGPRLSYGDRRFEGALFVPCSGAIDHPHQGDPVVVVEGDRRSMFLVNGEEDVFAGIFHLLALRDELRCTERDAHGRIPSSALFTVRQRLADRPWVEEKALELGASVERLWPGTVQRASRYQHIVSVDMDNILRYAGRPWWRAVGASMKDVLRGDRSSVAERWRVRAGRQTDPFTKAIDRVEAYRDHMDRALFFFLMRGDGEHDHAADAAHAITRASIQRASQVGEVGIHPSYRTSTDPGVAEQERTALQHIVGEPVGLSRQHFLRWDLPATLRQAADNGLAEEHTLGFSDRAGLRAGTCTPFAWYDTERERETELMLHPFAVMDSALIEQQGMGPTEVVRTMNAMSDRVRAVGGSFVSVWHDRYLSGHREFAPWPYVFAQVMQHARP